MIQAELKSHGLDHTYTVNNPFEEKKMNLHRSNS